MREPVPRSYALTTRWDSPVTRRILTVTGGMLSPYPRTPVSGDG
ncbi:hypothetical protein AB0C93_12200 [Streptomyces sp. NPDC048518]